MVVPGADRLEIFVEIVGHTRLIEPIQDLLLERPEQTLDSPVLPWTMRGGSLVANAQQPETEPKQPRSEDRLVVGSQDGRLAEPLEGIEQAAENADRGTIPQGGEREAEPAPVVEQSEHGPRALRPREKREIDSPEQILRHAPGLAMFELLAKSKDVFVVFLDELGDEGLADRLAPVREEEVEGVGDLASAVGHQSLEPENFLPYPFGLGTLEAAFQNSVLSDARRWARSALPVRLRNRS